MIRRSLSLSAIALLLQVGTAQAASLDKETCDKLKGEQAELEGAGARANMAKGPEWAKANLGPDKLGQIKRLIEVEELLLFRCQGRPLVVLPPEPELDPAAKADDKDDEKAPAAKDAKAAPAAGNAAQPAKAAVGGAAKTAGDTKPKSAPGAAKKADGTVPAKAAKAKPKADDAYKPPAGKN